MLLVVEMVQGETLVKRKYSQAGKGEKLGLGSGLFSDSLRLLFWRGLGLGREVGEGGGEK